MPRRKPIPPSHDPKTMLQKAQTYLIAMPTVEASKTAIDLLKAPLQAREDVGLAIINLGTVQGVVLLLNALYEPFTDRELTLVQLVLNPLGAGKPERLAWDNEMHGAYCARRLRQMASGEAKPVPERPRVVEYERREPHLVDAQLGRDVDLPWWNKDD